MRAQMPHPQEAVRRIVYGTPRADGPSPVRRESITDPLGLSAAAYCEAGDKIADALGSLLAARYTA